MQMVENFQGKGHHLYMDNFYTSPTLFFSLWDVGIGACGTLRCNRIGVATSIKNPPTKLKKGDIISEKKENLMFLKWKDKREVTLLTTLHDDATIMKRRRTSSVVGGYEEIVKPQAIEQYNKYMGGVDKLDQYLSYYNFNRRTKKWWRKAFLSLLDISITNAYILYSHSVQEGRKMTLIQFRIQLAKELLMETSQTVLPPSSSRIRTFQQSSLPPSACLTERHFPDKLPSRSNGQPGQRNCVVCSSKCGRPRKTTTYFCKKCGVGLCVVPCFELYHTKVNPGRYI